MLIRLFVSSILASCIGVSSFYEIIIYKLHANPAEVLIIALTLNRLAKLVLDVPSGILFFKFGYKTNLIIQHTLLITASVMLHQFKMITLPMMLIGSASVFFNGKYETAMFEYLKSKGRDVSFRKYISILYFLQEMFASISILLLKDININYIQIQTLFFCTVCILIGLTISYKNPDKLSDKFKVFNIREFLNNTKQNYIAILAFSCTYASVFSLSKMLNAYLIHNYNNSFSFKYTSMINMSVGFGAFFSFLFFTYFKKGSEKIIKFLFFFILFSDFLAILTLNSAKGVYVYVFAILISGFYSLVEVLTENFIEKSQFRILQISLSTWLANMLRFSIPLISLFFKNYHLGLTLVFGVHFFGICCLLLQLKKTKV